MTRQRMAQLARNLIGQCAYCDSPLHPGSVSTCYYHLTKIRARRRKKLGLNPGYVSGKGRPAITRLPMPDETRFSQAA